MSTLSNRWLIAVPIIAFWMVMMGLLFQRELGGSRLGSELPGRARSLAPSESWLGVFLTEGQRIGTVHLLQAPEARGDEAGVKMTLEARMSLRLLDKDTDLDLSGWVWQPVATSRAEFNFLVRSAGFDFEVTGEVGNGELRGEMISAGEVIPLRLPVDEDLMFSSGLGSALRFPRLEVGDEVRIDSFDPLTLSKSQARVRCTAREMLSYGGREVSTCRLTVTAGGLSSLAWVDDQGEVVRAETPIGLVLQRLPAEVAARPPEPPTSDAAAGLLGQTAIRPTGKLPFRSARKMTVRLSGLEALDLPTDRVQTSLGSGTFQVAVPAEPTAGWRPDAAAPTLESHLAADAFVQADHPVIRGRADTVAGGEEGPWLRSLAIHDWVFTRLEKEPVISIPSALEVLEQRRGDCNEHTVLFTALARAVAVPTRIAIGIVWSDELEGFYYHAWPEVYIGDWIWMDPTLDQPLADATHIKLINGGIETWPRLLPYLGKLEIEVLAVD